MKLITVEIRKPLHGSFVYINKAILQRAIRYGAKVEIAIPQGKTIVDPVEWMKNGKEMKKVFRYPDNPMILYGNYVNLPPKEQVDDKQDKLI